MIFAITAILFNIKLNITKKNIDIEPSHAYVQGLNLAEDLEGRLPGRTSK